MTAESGFDLDTQTRRNAERRPVRLMAKLRQRGAKALEIEVHDLSTHGFQVDTVHVIKSGQIVWLQFASLAPLQAKVCWFRDYRIGCAFVAPLYPAVLDAILATGTPR